jgi:hypothetical protein
MHAMCQTPRLSLVQGRSLLESAAINSSFTFLRRVFDMFPCHQTPVRLLTDSSINLPPKTVAFFVRMLRERAAVMSAPSVYPEPPELAGIQLALRRSEVRRRQ